MKYSNIDKLQFDYYITMFLYGARYGSMAELIRDINQEQ